MKKAQTNFNMRAINVQIKILILICFLLLFGFRSEKSSVKYRCGLPELEWMTVTEGYSSESLIKLASDIAIAAKADAANLQNAKVSGQAKFSLSGEFQKTVKKAKSKGYKVTQKFYMQYKSKRDALCNLDYIMNQSRRPLTDVQFNDAYKLYTDIDKAFSEIADELKNEVNKK